MILRPLQPDDGMLLKRIRLRSLADAPYAFGVESLKEESALPDAYWHQLAAQVGGQDPRWHGRCAGFVLLDDEGEGVGATPCATPCGTATCYLCPDVPGRAYFTAAWVDPRYRRRGLGRRLVAAAVDWAAAGGAAHLRLWVDDTNPAAAEFYQTLGFTPTGENRPIAEGSPDRQSSYELPLPRERAIPPSAPAW